MCEAFAVLADLMIERGIQNLAATPGLCEVQIDEKWSAKMNGHREEVEDVPGFSAAIFHLGVPAGIIHPFGGILAAADRVNEDAFIEACKAARGKGER